MRKKHQVTLTPSQRGQLLELVSRGAAPARQVRRAHILLHADVGPQGSAWSDARIAAAVHAHAFTVTRVRRQFVAEGLESTLRRRPAGHRPRKLDGVQEAHLVALACSEPPLGQARWTLRLLADKIVELEGVGPVSYECVRRTLKKTSSSRG